MAEKTRNVPNWVIPLAAFLLGAIAWYVSVQVALHDVSSLQEDQVAMQLEIKQLKQDISEVNVDLIKERIENNKNDFTRLEKKVDELLKGLLPKTYRENYNDN